MIIRNLAELKPVFISLYNQAEALLNCGKILEVEVVEKKSKRSLEQNNFYWLICGQVADFLDDAGLSYGEHNLPYNGELIHSINKQIFGIKTTTKLKVGEFCEYMNKVILFWQTKTSFKWSPSELPAQYLLNKGFTKEQLIL